MGKNKFIFLKSLPKQVYRHQNSKSARGREREKKNVTYSFTLYMYICINSEWIILKEKQDLNVHLLNWISVVHVFVFKIIIGGSESSMSRPLVFLTFFSFSHHKNSSAQPPPPFKSKIRQWEKQIHDLDLHKIFVYYIYTESFMFIVMKLSFVHSFTCSSCSGAWPWVY